MTSNQRDAIDKGPPAMYQSPQPVQSPRQPWGGPRATQPASYPVPTMWKGTVIQVTPEGYDESFAVGPDGFVWSYQTQHREQGAGRLTSTGLQAETFGVGRAGDGQLVVVAAEGAVLRLVAEAGDGRNRWSAPREVRFPFAGEGVRIEKVLTQAWAGQLYFAIVVRVVGADGRDLCFLWDATWDGDALEFAETPVDWTHGNAFWLEQLAHEGISID